MPSVGRGYLLNPVISPQATHTTEGGNAAFGAYSCSGEDEYAVGGGKDEHGREV